MIGTKLQPVDDARGGVPALKIDELVRELAREGHRGKRALAGLLSQESRRMRQVAQGKCRLRFYPGNRNVGDGFGGSLFSKTQRGDRNLSCTTVVEVNVVTFSPSGLNRRRSTRLADEVAGRRAR